jgi:manganese/iron transport system ATP-binding protein
VLRDFRLGGRDLHDDDDARSLSVLTDDERPLVFYGEKASRRQEPNNGSDGK